MNLRKLKRRRCVVQMRRCWITACLHQWCRPFQQALKQVLALIRTKQSSGQTPPSHLD
jgi:hypothetical protein